MGKKSKREYLQEINGRYKKASLEGKKKILDEFCNVCSYHRKYAIKLLNQYPLQEINRQRNRAGPKEKYHTEGVIRFRLKEWEGVLLRDIYQFRISQESYSPHSRYALTHN